MELESIQVMFKQDYLKSRAIRNRYNHFLAMKTTNENSIFLQEKHEETQNVFASKFSSYPDGLPYLEKGDQNSYLDQFLSIQPEVVQAADPPNTKEAERESVCAQKDQQFVVEEQRKFMSSSFHNFQKHLTVALKHSIDIPCPEQSSEVELIGFKLWKVFKTSTISTKKILHYLLGQKNEHPITPQVIKDFGFQKVYSAHDDKQLKAARIYLAQETLRQIKEGKLQEYIILKKLKDKEMFKKYVQIFVKELQTGFLKKRLSKQSVYELLKM